MGIKTSLLKCFEGRIYKVKTGLFCSDFIMVPGVPKSKGTLETKLTLEVPQKFPPLFFARSWTLANAPFYTLEVCENFLNETFFFSSGPGDKNMRQGVECLTLNFLTALLNQYWLLNSTDYLKVLFIKQYCFWNWKTLGKQFLWTCFETDRKIWRVWWSTNHKNDYPCLKSQEKSSQKNNEYCLLISTV